MAENEPRPADVDALAAMAAGADLDEPNPYLEQQAEIENPNAVAAPAPDVAQFTAAQTAPAGDPRVIIPAGPQVSRSEAAKRLAAQSAAAYSSQFKKMMIPLMICVGGLLVALALFALFGSSIIFRGEGANSAGMAWAFVLGPLGLILLVGAYWFMLEGKKKK